tara:strand:+ start:529 stop:1167 length:639 start_codon:yes stop_codon:yes gene_type:complete
MLAYASWTGTRKNLDGLKAAGWRLLTGPHIMKGRKEKLPKWTDGTVAPYMLDNGAWTAFQQQEPFDGEAFEECVRIAGKGADCIVVPDIVEGGLDSLAFSMSWMPYLKGYRVLLAVQDGIEAEDVRQHLGPRVGIFVGGSTEWKLETARVWGRLARSVGCHLHIARVNTAKRIRLCQFVQADSFDGTSATRFLCSLPRLNNALRQQTIWGLS